MFNKLKKAKNEIMGDGNPFAVAKKKCKEVGLPFNYFTEFVKNKGLNPLTDTTFELVDEFFNRPHPLYKLSIPVYVTLPETVFEFWEKKLYGNRERDERNQKELKEMGWTVITVWECELKKDKCEQTLEDLYIQITS